MTGAISTEREHPLRSGWLWFCITLTALKLWLIDAQTVSAVAPAPSDDELFLSHAETILRGEWLGPFSDLTLVKGPAYPLWLAANHLIGLPLLLTQAFLYAMACSLLVVAIRPVLAPRWARALLYAALLFNPSSWADGPATRVIRDGFYSSMTLLLLGAAAGLVLRVREGTRVSLKWALCTGVAGAVVAMTREEGLWLVPSLLLLSVLGIVRAWPVGWRAWVTPAAIATGAYLLPVGTVAAVNYRQYGIFTTCEMTSDYFQAAYGALTRVKAAAWHPYIPVPADARRRIYGVSAAFREVGPYLEPTSESWGKWGCQNLGVCNDIAGGWFIWAFRQAATAAGKYGEGGAAARDWYRQLTHEIDDACREGALECLPPRSSLVSPWREAYLGPLLSTFGRAVMFFITFDSVSPLPTPARSSEFDLLRYEAMAHERIPRSHVVVSGLLASRVPILRAAVADYAGRDADATIRSFALPVTEATTRGSTLTRYEVTTSCSEGCRLMFLTGPREAVAVPISETLGDRSYQSGNWHTETFLRETASVDRTTALRITLLEILTRVYSAALPVCLVMALLFLFRRLWLALRARAFPDVAVLALTLAGACVVRLLLLSFIEVSSFKAVVVEYCAPAYALCVASVVLLLVSEIAEARRHQKPSNSVQERSSR
jgi:hypothetical protein